jgi:hypothetical protein
VHYESNGIFSVRSAYKLAYNIQQNVNNLPGNSISGDASRNTWKSIWSAPVPNKIRVFGWRAAKDNLATKRNKFKRTLEFDSVCPVCGNGVENSYHAIVECTKARALRLEMRKIWDLPEESAFRYTGPDWLQIMLSNIQESRRRPGTSCSLESMAPEV